MWCPNGAPIGPRWEPINFILDATACFEYGLGMAKKQGKIGYDRSEIVAQLPEACRDEAAAVEFMERQRWGDEPRCPHCGFTDVYQMLDRETGERNKRHLWRCRNCKTQYTVRIGTVLEDSRIPLRHWCFAFWQACAAKKGVSALQIKRMTGLSYKSALFLMHRIRFAMDETERPGRPLLKGTIEADETYVGGKPRNKGPHNNPLKGKKEKSAVFAMIERGGNARAMVLPEVNSANLAHALRSNTSFRSRLMTDESSLYSPSVVERFNHGHFTVNHSAKEYTRGDAHTNTAESFFSLIKRGIYGTFHNVSKYYLPLYVAEFEFRYNSRKINDGARTALAIKGAEGKRLYYREPVN